jgi:HEAT repeat protein
VSRIKKRAKTIIKSYINGIEIPNELSENMLEKLLANYPEKWAAFEVLGNKNTLSSLEVLKKYALSGDRYEKIAAMNSLSKHGLGAQAADIIYKNLKSTDQLIMTAACNAVGGLGLKQFHEEIAFMLKSKDPNVRQAAIFSLSNIWLPSDFDLLALIYRRDKRCRKDAAYVLYDHADPLNWKTAFELFASDKEVHRHRRFACHIASQYGGKDIIEAIKVLSNDPDGHVRKDAQRALLILTQE